MNVIATWPVRRTFAASASPAACRICVPTGDDAREDVVAGVSVVARHLPAAGRGVGGPGELAEHDVARRHSEREDGSDRAVERDHPVVAGLERGNDADLGALVALATDHERGAAGAIEHPQPFVERPRERDLAVEIDEPLVRQPDRRAKPRGRGCLGHQRAARHQKLMDRPSTAIAASPMISERVGCGCVAAPISHAAASSVSPSDVSAMRSVACGPMTWTPSVSPGLRVRDHLREPLVLAADDRLGDRLERHLARPSPAGRAPRTAARSGRSRRSPAGSTSRAAAGRSPSGGRRDRPRSCARR